MPAPSSDAFETLKAKLNEAAQHIEAQEHSIRELQVQLASDYEIRFTKAKAEFQLAQTELDQKVLAAQAEAFNLQAELEQLKEKAREDDERETRAEDRLSEVLRPNFTPRNSEDSDSSIELLFTRFVRR